LFFSGSPTPRTPQEQPAVSYNVYARIGAPAIHTNDEVIYSAYSFTAVDGSTRLVINIAGFETPHEAQLFLHELMGQYHDMPVAGAAVH
jgi:hypothetical protein